MAPPLLVPSRPAAGGAVAAILAGVRAGDGPGVDELVTLFDARRQDVAAVAALADELRRETVGDTVTWVHNRNINYTNVCTFQVPVLRVLEGPVVAQPARRAVPADARRHCRAEARGVGAQCSEVTLQAVSTISLAR